MSEPINVLKEKVGLNILKQLEANKSPEIAIPKRTSDNVTYNDVAEMLELGDKTLTRKMNSLGQLRSFSQLILIAKTIIDAKEELKYSTKRDIYYNAWETIKGTKIDTLDSQKESDAIINDLEVITGLTREEMGITADERSLVSGKLTLVGYSMGEKQVVNCDVGLTGQPIPTNIHEMEIKDVDADHILVIEKQGIFKSLRESKYTKTNRCILITGKGQPDRGSRKLVRRLNKEFSLPVFILTDSDPSGFQIFMVYRIGSQNLSYMSEKLACPSAKFIGVYPSDINKYKLSYIKAKPYDITKATNQLSLQQFNTKKWQEELKLFLKEKKKVEIQSLRKRSLGFKFLAEKYIPERVKMLS